MSLSRTLPWAAGAAAFAVYAWLAAPGPYWLDSQELGAAAVQLGVPHPTGFPLFCLAGRLLAWLLPFGELAFRVHLGSAAAAALAIGVAARLTIAIAGEDLPAAIGALAAALVAGASMTFYRSALVTEVYAGMAAALAIALLGLLRVARGAPAKVGLALAFGAGIAATGLHMSFVMLAGTPFVVVFLLRLRGGARWPLLAPALFAIGAAGMAAFMPARSASGHVDVLDWDHTRRAAGLVDHLSAGRIRRAYKAQMLGGTEEGKAVSVAASTERDLGVLALLAAVGGALALVRRRREGRVGGLLLLAVVAGDVAYAVLINPMGVRDRQTGVPLALAAAVLAGAGLAAASRIFKRFAPFAAAVLVVMVSAQPLLEGAEARAALRAGDAPRAYAEAILAACAPGAIVLTRSDSVTATLWWLTIAEPVRPDVAVLARQHLWDTGRNRAVLARAGVALSATGAEAARKEILGGRRAVAWELPDDPPAGVPVQPGAPVLIVGSAARAGAKPVVADLDRIFPPATLAEEETRRMAANAYNDAAVVLGTAREFERAARLAERSSAIRDSLNARLNAARYRLGLSQDRQALVELDAAERLDPRSATQLALRGIIAARAGRCAAAAQLLDRALAIDPGQRDAAPNRKKLARECREGEPRR